MIIRLATLLVLSFVALPSSSHAQDPAPVCQRPFVFFDLGDTLIDTATHKFNPMFLMPGALEYLTELKKNGYPIGLISDVSEAWGRDKSDVNGILDYPTAKWMRLIHFIRGVYPEDKSSWRGPLFEPTWFGTFEKSGAELVFKGYVFLPLKDTERKRSGNLALFQRALKAAQAKGCRALYFGEDASEMNAARAAGLVPFHVGHTPPDSFFLPVDKIEDYLRANPVPVPGPGSASGSGPSEDPAPRDSIPPSSPPFTSFEPF